MNAMGNLSSIQARAITPEAKTKLYETAISLQQERGQVSRSALLAGWCVGGVGAVMSLAAMACVAILLPLHTVEVQYFVVDRTSGYTGPSVSPADAPRLFSEATAQFEVQRYIELRENYQWESDDLAFHRASIMSSPDEQIRYKAMHDDPRAPAKALRDRGYVRVRNFEFSKIGDAKAQTKIYAVRFERIEVLAGRPVPDRGDYYTATVQFQFHPEYPMSLPDRRLNPDGMQVISYQVDKAPDGGDR